MRRRNRVLLTAAAQGALCGLAGVAVMTAGELAEQAITKRPDSYVPARALLGLLGRPVADDARPTGWNHAMHWGTGAVVGTLRGVWAAVGIRGASANAHFAAVRLAFDQTIENGTGAGAPPTTWPESELAADLLHKTVYAVATGVLADRLIRPTLESRRGRRSH